MNKGISNTCNMKQIISDKTGNNNDDNDKYDDDSQMVVVLSCVWIENLRHRCNTSDDAGTWQSRILTRSPLQ